jgi:hypothetical protein
LQFGGLDGWEIFEVYREAIGEGEGSAEIDKIIDDKIMGGRIIGNHQSHQ